MTAATTTDADFGRALAFDRALYERACERAEPHPWGVAMFDTRRPRFWALNSLHAGAPLPRSFGAREAVAELERLYAGFPHRRLFVADDAGGRRIAPAMLGMGWGAHHEVFMALRGDRDRPPSPGLAREASEEELRAVERAMLTEDPGGSPDVLDEIVAGRSAIREAAPVTRRFVGAYEGRDGATATLYSDGTVAQVEDVGTLVALRGRGLARAVVSAAVDAALADGNELVMLVADDDDWPKELYAKLGFDPIGKVWAFLRAARSPGA